MMNLSYAFRMGLGICYFWKTENSHSDNFGRVQFSQRKADMENGNGSL